MEDIANEFRPHYEHVWNIVLREWLYWDQLRSQSWLACFEQELSGADQDWSFYHDPVLRRVAPLLIRDDLRLRLSTQADLEHPSKLVAVQFEVEDAATFSPTRLYCDSDDYDWSAARDRVRTVLTRNGSDLPGPDEITSYEHRIRATRHGRKRQNE